MVEVIHMFNEYCYGCEYLENIQEDMEYYCCRYGNKLVYGFNIHSLWDNCPKKLK